MIHELKNHLTPPSHLCVECRTKWAQDRGRLCRGCSKKLEDQGLGRERAWRWNLNGFPLGSYCRYTPPPQRPTVIDRVGKETVELQVVWNGT